MPFVMYSRYKFLGKFQACGFLVSSHNLALSDERELQENVFSNDAYVETASLLEQVFCSTLYHPSYLLA